jgi:hypothetical protein
MSRRLGEGGVIHQTHLAQSVKHWLADLLRNLTPAQCVGQFSPAARPRREQPQADRLRLCRRSHDPGIRGIVPGEPVGAGTTLAHRNS